MEEWTVSQTQKPDFFSPPILIAAWPGMGQVGVIAVDYLHKKLASIPFATLTSSEIIPDSVLVEKGIARLPEVPMCRFFYNINEAKSQTIGKTKRRGTYASFCINF